MLLTCSCNDRHDDNIRPRLWHRAYRRWYAHHRAGHRARAAAWAWLSDRLCALAD